jgi:hypothetical protein
VRVQRLVDGPIISPDLHSSIGVNIQGPSMIRVPDWVKDRHGDYYLYFADHKGRYIRLAYADHLAGAWRIYEPGCLQLQESGFLTAPPQVTPEQIEQFEAQRRESGVEISHDVRSEITTPHIASPDVHVDPLRRQIVMYFHGLDDVGTQVTRAAISDNGIDFAAQPETLGRSYMRVFSHGGMAYALAMPGRLPVKGRFSRIRAGSDPVQPAHAPFSRIEARQRAVGFLDAGWRRARTNPG